MRRTLVGLSIFIAVALAGCRARGEHYARASGYPPAGPHAPPPGWIDVQQPQAGFACQMPALPLIETDSGNDEDGARYLTVRARANVAYGTFGMIVTQWEGGVVGDPLAIARHLAETALELADTPDHRARRVSMPGFYAREDTGRTPDGAFFAVRQFYGRDRVYVAVTAVRNEAYGLRAAEQFMQSIALDRRDGLLPYGGSDVPVPLYLPDVDFSVSMPPLAVRRSADVEIEDATTEAWVFESRHAHGLYRVTVILFEDGCRDDALANAAAALSLGRAGEYVHASGFPGRSYETSDDRAVRAFVTEQRVYVLEVTGASALGADATQAFFGSLRIL